MGQGSAPLSVMQGLVNHELVIHILVSSPSILHKIIHKFPYNLNMY